MTFPLYRRQFLYLTGGLALSLLYNSPSFGQMDSSASDMFEINVYNPDGSFLKPKPLNQLYFLTLDYDPIPNPPRRPDGGKLLTNLPDFPVAIALKLPVTDFGEVFLYADNRGKGYSKADFPLDLNLAFADSRLYAVKSSLKRWEKEGFRFSPDIYRRLERADNYLERARSRDNIAEKVRQYDRSLYESMWAGEELVYSKSEQVIRANPRSPDFLFGCNFFGYPGQGKKYEYLFEDAFNFATVPFYWRDFDPKTVNKQVNFLNSSYIVPKGHPLVWFHEVGIPDAIRDKSFEEIKNLVANHVRRVTGEYRDKIGYFDIINEANGIPWANKLNFTLDRFIELTRIASLESRRGNPQVYRIVNNCCLWGENVAYFQPPQYSPYQYLKTCIEAGIEFEAIGLQLYYPDRDMFEIDRILEKYARFGKPIHITELGVSSDTTIDEDSYLKEPLGLWHSPWSEKVQADWLEQFYTLCYSKSYIKAVSWWDLTDNGSFWPHGGLVRRDMTPKLAYEKLRELTRSWREIKS